MKVTPIWSLRDAWYDAVLCTPRLRDASRVLCMLLADYMDRDGFVSVPRRQLSARLGVNPRRVTERFHHCIEMGYLIRVQEGRRGHVARYQATIPRERREMRDSA